MSLAAQAATTVVALIAAVTAVSLWRGANRHTGSVRRAYLWFALTALLWGAGAIGQQVLASAWPEPRSRSPAPTCPGSWRCPPCVTGLISLDPGARRHLIRWPSRTGPIGTAVARCADGYVVASALFIIGWITVLSASYVHSGDDPGTFAAELVHPLADLLVLGAVLPLAMAAGPPRRSSRPGPAGGNRERHARGRGEDQQRASRRGLPAAADRGVPRPGLRTLDGRLVARGPGGCGPVHPGRAHAVTTLAGVTAAAAALVLVGWVLAGSPAPSRFSPWSPGRRCSRSPRGS